MIKNLRLILGEGIFRQSAVLFSSSIFVNILNLVFWLYMVRSLSAVDYGILNTLVSLLTFFSMPLSITQLVITRYVSKFIALERQTDVVALISNFSKLLGSVLVFILVFFVLFSHQIAAFLNIQSVGLILLTGAGVIFGSFSAVTMGTLAGLQKFNDVSANNVVTAMVKLGGGILLVVLGTEVFGALSGFVISLIFSFLFSINQLPEWLKKCWNSFKTPDLEKKDIYGYFIPVGLATVCFFLLTNADVILVKHYFSEVDAGYYSVAQMVGKIVLFVPAAIGVVMFPKVVETHSKNMNTRSVLNKCLGAVGLISGLAFVFALFFPEFILKTLTGHSQPQAVNLVKFFALSMAFFALVNIFMIYNLSIHNMRYIYSLLIVSCVQLLSICLFHSTLEQVLTILVLGAVSLFFLGLWMSEGELT